MAPGALEQVGRYFGRLVWAGCSDLLTKPLEGELLDQRVCATSLLMCEARRATCSTIPSPPLAGQRLYGAECAVHFVGVCKRRRNLLTFDDEELRPGDRRAREATALSVPVPAWRHAHVSAPAELLELTSFAREEALCVAQR